MFTYAWRATYADNGESVEDVNSSRYTPAATYREAQVVANRTGRAIHVRRTDGAPGGRLLKPEGGER